MKNFYGQHPAIFSFIFAILVIFILGMLSPLALQAGEYGMDWYTLIMFTSVFFILTCGQFKSATMQRRVGSKFLATIHYIFGTIFAGCGVVVIIAGIDALMK